MTNSILNEICIFMPNLFDIKIEVIEANISNSLLGEPFYWQPEKLLYLFFYLENKYNFKFKKEDILNYNFTSVENIINLVKANV